MLPEAGPVRLAAFDAGTLPSRTYLVRLEAAGAVPTRSVLLVK